MQQGLFADDERGRKTLAEVEAWLEGAPEPWVEGYAFLRARGVSFKHALLACWLSLRKDDRGELRTRAALAEFLGVAKQTTYDWEEKYPVQTWAEMVLARRLRGMRLAEVDERTFEAASAATGSYNDRKLFYQRAGVWDENPAGEEEGITIILDGPR